MARSNPVAWISLCAAFFLVLQAAPCQTKSGNAPTSGTGTTTGPSKTTTIPTQPPPPTPPPPPQPIFLTGRVLAEDGKPPMGETKIERVCNGEAHAEGYADASGYFSIELGGRHADAFQDASEAGTSSLGPLGGEPGSNTSTFGAQQGSNSPVGLNQGQRFLSCELRASISGYRSQAILLDFRHPLDNPDIGVILVHREQPGEDGTVVSARSLAAPKDAKKAFDKGLELVRKGNLEDARKNFEKAVAVYPEYSTAWCELGKLQVAQGQSDIARGSFQYASKADPKYLDPYVQLSLLALRDKNWPLLAELTDKAGQLDTFDYPQVFFFNAVAYFNLHQIDPAEKSILRAERLDTRHKLPEIAHLHAVILLQRHNYPAAAERLRAYLTWAPDAADAEKIRAQVAQLEKLTAQNSQDAAEPAKQQ